MKPYLYWQLLQMALIENLMLYLEVLLVFYPYQTLFWYWEIYFNGTTHLAEAKVLLELKWLFTDILFLLLLMIEWLSYFLMMLPNIIILTKSSLWQTILFWYQATGPFCNVNIMLINPLLGNVGKWSNTL